MVIVENIDFGPRAQKIKRSILIFFFSYKTDKILDISYYIILTYFLVLNPKLISILSSFLSFKNYGFLPVPRLGPRAWPRTIRRYTVLYGRNTMYGIFGMSYRITVYGIFVGGGFRLYAYVRMRVHKRGCAAITCSTYRVVFHCFTKSYSYSYFRKIFIIQFLFLIHSTYLFALRLFIITATTQLCLIN